LRERKRRGRKRRNAPLKYVWKKVMKACSGKKRERKEFYPRLNCGKKKKKGDPEPGIHRNRKEKKNSNSDAMKAEGKGGSR